MRENTTHDEVGCVCFDGEGEVWLIVLEDKSRGEGLLELPKRHICCWGPGEPDAFFGKGGEGGSEGIVVEDEFSVEV